MENITIRYDTVRFPFTNVLRDIFSDAFSTPVEDLAALHLLSPISYGRFNENTDQFTFFHEAFYARMESAFLSLYRRFVEEFVAGRVGTPFIFQTVPTFRVHLPGNVSVGSFHRDTDFGHDSVEQNWWVPCTEARETSTVWVESTAGTDDFQPREARYGDVVLFDGANLRHGNKINATGKTRVSFDFRTIPRAEYRENRNSSMTTKKKFIIGDYWSEL